MSARLSPERIAEIEECLRVLGVTFTDEILDHINAVEAELAEANDVIAEYEIKIEDLEKDVQSAHF